MRLAGLAAVLLTMSTAGAGSIPSRSEVLQVVDKHLARVDAAVSAEQKTKIWSYVNAFPGQDTSVPGYSFTGGSGHVETKNRIGALFQAGFEAVFKGQIPVATWCFLQALKINCDCPVILSNAAFTLNRSGYYTDALTLLNYAVTLDPSFSSAWVNIASGAFHLKRYDTAKKALQMAIALSPEITDYQDMLKGVYAASGTKKKVETADLDAALGVLAKGKEAAAAKNSGTGAKANPQGAAGAAGGEADSLISGMGASYQNDMNILSQFLPVLAQAGGQFLKESQWHLDKAKDADTNLNKDLHYVASTGWGLLSTLFKGYIADISGSWSYADDLLQKQAKSIPNRPADYKPWKTLTPDFNLPPISIGFDGIVLKLDRNSDEIECEIGEGVIFGFSHSSQGWSVKVGLGLQMQAGFMTGGGLAYFLKYDSTTGIKTEAKGEIMSFGAKAETTFSESTLFSFEDMKDFAGISKK